MPCHVDLTESSLSFTIVLTATNCMILPTSGSVADRGTTTRGVINKLNYTEMGNQYMMGNEIIPSVRLVTTYIVVKHDINTNGGSTHRIISKQVAARNTSVGSIRVINLITICA